MELSQVIQGFFIVRRTRLAATTQTNYRYCFDKLERFFGAEKLFDAITPLDIHKFLDSLLEAGLSERSVHDNFAILSALWSFAHKEFGFPHAASKVETPKFRKPSIVPFTLDECKAMVNAAEWKAAFDNARGRRVRSHRPTYKRDIAVIATLLDTGLRASELCHLAVADFNQETGRLHVLHGKGDKERFVFLGNNGQRILYRYLISRERIKGTDPLFAARNNQNMERNNLRHLLNRVGQNAGVADVHPHRFRHTFAIEFLRNGGNIYELQRLLGHESLETVRVYLNLSESDLQRSMHANSPVDNWRI